MLQGRPRNATTPLGGPSKPGGPVLVEQRLLGLFVAGWTLLSFPMLALWDHDVRVLGLPLFPLALFGIWALLIGALAWVVERGAEHEATEPPHSPAPPR